MRMNNKNAAENQAEGEAQYISEQELLSTLDQAVAMPFVDDNANEDQMESIVESGHQQPQDDFSRHEDQQTDSQAASSMPQSEDNR